VRHAQKAIELDLTTAAAELSTRTASSSGETAAETPFVSLIEDAQRLEDVAKGLSHRKSAQAPDSSGVAGHADDAPAAQRAVPENGKPSPRQERQQFQRRKSDGQPSATATPTTAAMEGESSESVGGSAAASACTVDDPYVSPASSSGIKQELSGQQRRLARLAAEERKTVKRREAAAVAAG
jgi:hypothetical protein